MVPSFVLRPALIAIATIGLSACGVRIDNDGHMFQRMSDRVSAIPVEDPASDLSAAQDQPASAPSKDQAPVTVAVVDPLDMPNAADAGLRRAIRAVADQTEKPEVQAGLRAAIHAAVTGEERGSVQLAAFPSEDSARQAWRMIVRAHPDALGGLKPSFERADLGAKGVWFRLKAGPVLTASQAREVCAAAGVDGRWCASASAPRA
jgi:hypothetical protein